MKKSNLIFLFIIFFTFSVFSQNIGLNIGDKAPELNFWNPDSTQQIPLSSLQGKIVLVDFWASWCGPCRMENPDLVKNYNKYRNANFNGVNGFEIYSVSLDQQRSAWINAIQKDSLYWDSHVSDLTSWLSQPAQIYSINSIPSSFLLDENGIIIGKNLRGAKLDSALNNLQNSISITTETKNMAVETGEIKIFPNPANDMLTVEGESGIMYKITVFNILDERVLDKTFTFQQQIIVRSWNNGIYFYILEQSGIIISSGKIIVLNF